ncbi:MAG TPA: O-antigen ligase family protein [Pyrinomonadaceae bacterium]|nr:O-antigen ligase family protein [Pyrinomonadaceae bacterium]
MKTKAKTKPRARASAALANIIFYSLLVLILLLATPYGIVSPWRGVAETVFECGVFALGVLWMAEGLLGGGWVNSRHLLVVPVLLLAAFAFVQTFPFGNSDAAPGISAPAWQAVSFDPYETRLVGLKLLAYALALGLLLRYAATPARLRTLVLFVIGLAVASALFAITLQAVQRGAAEFLFPSVRLNRGYGQFVNRNHFAYLMEMALGLVLGLIAAGRRREPLLVYLAAAVPLWTALVLSNSRGGILAMLCQLILLALMFASVRRRGERESRPAGALGRLAQLRAFRPALVAALLVAAMVGVVWVGGEQIVGRFETLPGEVAAEADAADPGVSRREIWATTVRMIKDHPLLGVGLGGYWTAVPQYHNASGKMTPQQAHNDYLELLAGGGIIALLLGAWFVLLFLKFARAPLGSADTFRRASCFGALLGLFGVAVHSLVDFGLHIPVNALVCLVLIAIAAAENSAEKSLTPSPVRQ